MQSSLQASSTDKKKHPTRTSFDLFRKSPKREGGKGRGDMGQRANKNGGEKARSEPFANRKEREREGKPHQR